MAKISNSDEGQEFESRCCGCCVHEGDPLRPETTCPIIVAQLVSTGDPAIDHFLTRDSDGVLQCSMWIERHGLAPWDREP